MRRDAGAERASLLALRAQQGAVAVSVAAGIALFFVDPDRFQILSVWSTALSALSAFVLEAQRRLLPDLYAFAPVPAEDGRFARFRALYLWGLGGATVQFGLVALLVLLSVDNPAAPDFNPGTAFMLLVSWAFVLYASFRTLVAFTVALRAPLAPAARPELREWLLRGALAGALFSLLNVLEGLRGPVDAAEAVSLALYVVVAALDVLAALLIRRALVGRASSG